MSKHQLGDRPIEDQYRTIMQDLARALDRSFNREARGDARKTGFVLLVFPFGSTGQGDGRCNYISNGADRNDIVVLMKEIIARFEGQPETKGSA